MQLLVGIVIGIGDMHATFLQVQWTASQWGTKAYYDVYVIEVCYDIGCSLIRNLNMEQYNSCVLWF